LGLKVHAEKMFKDKKQLYTASVAEPFVTCRLGKPSTQNRHTGWAKKAGHRLMTIIPVKS